ncbi:MAG: ATP-binding protein [Pseudobdellovibrionaceae bacterium]
MWIKRDFQNYIQKMKALPIKVLKGPRQVGKTSLLLKMGGYRALYFDDLLIRKSAQENPRLFFDQFNEPLIVDEATLAPQIFLELKRRVDQSRRDTSFPKVDIWITGSNQTLLQRNVSESLTGRASYFDLNTLSLHELGPKPLGASVLKGGWPELHVDEDLDPTRYLNDLILTFIEKDIVSAAGIERREAFSRSLHLISGRVGQLLNFSDIAKNVGVDVTTLQSWTSILEQNGLVRKLQPFSTNLNQRLIKTPKIYFEDVGLASRLQGWTEFFPLMSSPQFGHLVENVAISEVSKFFSNRGSPCNIFYVRSKEKVEVDLLIELPNNRYIAAEIKVNPQPWSEQQHKLINTLGLNIIERWIITPTEEAMIPNNKVVNFNQIWIELNKLW